MFVSSIYYVLGINHEKKHIFYVSFSSPIKLDHPKSSIDFHEKRASPGDLAKPMP